MLRFVPSIKQIIPHLNSWTPIGKSSEISEIVDTQGNREIVEIWKSWTPTDSAIADRGTGGRRSKVGGFSA